jgi:ankyrin repeat protein
MYAAKNGNLGVAKYLIAKGASLEAKDWNASTPLYIAVEYEQTNLANFLLSTLTAFS